jgi:tetratricopeptide (TPR) repeat protein
MRHIPFMKALAEVKDTSDPVWRDASAGYLVLRFFDRWLDDGPALASFDQTLPALKARLSSAEDVHPQVQTLLMTAVQTMIDAPGTNPASVAGPLLAYGHYLETASRFDLAAHVYQTLIDALDPPSGCVDLPLAAMTLIRYGAVLRVSGDFDASRDAYRHAEILATKGNVVDLMLQSRVGMANTLQGRGNLGESETLLDQVIADASIAGIVRVRAFATHTRGSIRTLRGKYVEAMTDFFEAYKMTEDVSEQERILNDLAVCAGEAGYRTMARDAYRVLAYAARTPIIRLIAFINLLEMAAQDGDIANFERIQEHIRLHGQKHSLPIQYALSIALYTAYGAERFGPREVAIAAYQEVIAQARKTGMYQVVFNAEERLEILMSGPVTQSVPESREPPDSLRHMVDTIAEWGELAVHTP